MDYPNATWQVGTITLGASGGAESSGTIVPVKCNSMFRSLSLQIYPLETNVEYEASIYFGGQLFETHSFPDVTGKTIMRASYPRVLFAPTIGVLTHPNFFIHGKYDPNKLPITVYIVNAGTSEATFQVESFYEAFDTYVATKLN